MSSRLRDIAHPPRFDSPLAVVVRDTYPRRAARQTLNCVDPAEGKGAPEHPDTAALVQNGPKKGFFKTGLNGFKASSRAQMADGGVLAGGWDSDYPFRRILPISIHFHRLW